MFYLLGEKECLRTLLLLTAREGGVAENESRLKERYHDLVAAIGGPELRPPSLALDDRICYDEARIRKLVAKYMAYSGENDTNVEVTETPLAARQEAMTALFGAMDYIKSVNPALRHLFDLVIHTLFYQRSKFSGGGSISSAPGVIWCAPRRYWSRTDLAEFLVHELSHNLLFWDERRHEHYLDYGALQDPANHALSAVRKIPRTLDRAFHSLVVASEVLCFRGETGEPATSIVHPPSHEMRRACLETIASMRAVITRRELVTPRFLDIVQGIEEKISSTYQRRHGEVVAA